MDAILEVIDISKIYGKGDNRVIAVDSVTLSLKRQELLLIMGPSGSGKTTLISIMGCILHPTGGEVIVDGQTVSSGGQSGRHYDDSLPDIRKKYFGFVFQSFNLFPSLKAVENVELVLRLKKCDKKKIRSEALGLIERVGRGIRKIHCYCQPRPKGRGISPQGRLFGRREDKDLKKIFIVIGLIFLVIVGYVVFSDKKGVESKIEVMPKTETVKYVAAEGKAEARPGFEVEVGSEIEGKLAEFFVNEGDEVKKGELVARLENRDIQAKLKEAEAELTGAKSRLKEVASGAREEEIKGAKAALEGAIANMDMAKKELERYERLFKESVITKSAIDEKERAFKVAAAREKEAEEEVRLLEKGPRQETLQFHEDAGKRAHAD